MSLNKHDIQYHNMLAHIMNYGVDKSDRTGTGTRSVFQYQMRFDVSDGSIPLLTTKKLHTKSIIHELIWFLNGDTNIKYLNDNGVSIWDEFANEDGELGPVYGYMWRRYPSPNLGILVPNKIHTDTTSLPVYPKLTPDINSDAKYIGNTYSNIDGDEYTVICVDGNIHLPSGIKHGNTYTVQFVESGFIKKHLTSLDLKRSTFRDSSIPTVCGVGRLGEYYPRQCSKEDRWLKNVWQGMITRCYTANDTSSKRYYDRGVTVCNRWLDLSCFIQDAKKLPGFINRQFNNNYELDKDYYGNSLLYSPDTCVWIPKRHNGLYKQNVIPVICTNPQYPTLYFPSISEAQKHLQLTSSQINRALVTNKTYNGWSIRKYFSDETNIRYPLDVDQITNLINDIKHSPNSRRLLVNSWHPALLPDTNIPPNQNPNIGRQCLPPCHMMFQCYVANGKLSLALTQRSCDTFLGVPFNIAQYSILLHLLAKVTDLEPGEFIWNGGDVHIYSNHFEQVNLQLSRDSAGEPPFLAINAFKEDIFDFKYEDFIIAGYKAHPAIKAPVAV